MENMIYEDLLARFVEMSKEILEDNLIGIYLHGSLAMNCFNSEKSDLDLIIVVNSDISMGAKLDYLENVLKLNEEAPAKGIELSVVKREFCRPFVYPTPYELHFSNTYLDWIKERPKEYIENVQGTDRDLAAHFTIINNYGIVLYGEAIKDVFGKVTRENYIDSIWYDVENAEEDIVTNPMYVTLNLCRVLAYLEKDLVLSKKAGGQWGIENLPEEHKDTVRYALRCYGTDEDMDSDLEKVKSFARYMIDGIRGNL